MRRKKPRLVAAPLGFALGGAPAVVRALLTALGPEGTLVMPAFSPGVSDPAR